MLRCKDLPAVRQTWIYPDLLFIHPPTHPRTYQPSIHPSILPVVLNYLGYWGLSLIRQEPQASKGCSGLSCTCQVCFKLPSKGRWFGRCSVSFSTPSHGPRAPTACAGVN